MAVLKIKRLSNWERRLDAHFVAARTIPFALGRFDCALAACQAVAAITGVDPGAAWRGEYSSASEAAALIALHGATLSLEAASAIDSAKADLGSLAADIAAAHGFAEVKPTFAQRGDVVLVDNGDPARALGTVDLSGRFAWCVGGLAGNDRGFVRVPMQRWLRAWHVG